MSIPEKVKDRLPNSLIFLGYRGSQAHGTYVPNSNPDSIDDIDLMGVFIASIGHYFGFGRNEVLESFPDEYDTVCYELKKFVNLLMKNNPNVLSMLWLEEESTLYSDSIWRYLVQNRDLFVSKLAYHSFTGYAYAQLKKMTAFNQSEQERVKSLEDELRVLHIEFGDGGVPKLPAGATDFQIEKARQYNEVRSKYFAGYMGDKRKNNVLKFGYDTKNASHLVRLLRMCEEFLETGQFTVLRPDAASLLDIKQGKWKLAEVQEEAEGLFTRTKKLFESSSFPERPDKEKVEQLLVNVLGEHFSKQELFTFSGFTS